MISSDTECTSKLFLHQASSYWFSYNMNFCLTESCRSYNHSTDKKRMSAVLFSWKKSVVSYQSKNIKEFPSVEVQQGTNVRVDLLIHRSLC